MEGKQVAGLALLLGAAAGGFYAYSKGWYSNLQGVGALSDRQQSLKWYGEQMRYKGKDVNIHEFVDGATGLSGTMEQHLSNVLGRKKVQPKYQKTVNAVGRPL